MNLTGAEARRHFEAARLDYAAIGFRCGLEIHQQLNTGKLFSRVPSEVIDGAEELQARTVGSITRRLRATGGESGQMDAAAAAEVARNRTFRYLIVEGVTSLVELDEEPPRPLDPQAYAVGLQFAGLLASRPVDEVHIMRKTVVDGSNTGGFQRTALIATGGSVAVEGGDVGIWTVALEEDSARPQDEVDGVATYSLDRLGIPLVEVATAPDCRDPAHAQRTAARLGALLRSTRNGSAAGVKRGLGTIRQDLNVSVGVGDRVEIKGCQDLRAVARVIEAECRRQLWMHHVRMELASRGFDPEAPLPASDVSGAFAATTAKMVAESVQRGHVVLGVRLPRFAGLLKGASKDGPRLGRELADHAKVAAGVKGIFHSDELPAYGITAAEVEAVRKALGCQEGDGFALCIGRAPVAQRAIEAVVRRARAASGPAAKEVRGAQPDDSTRYMRPMPGAARMYPETDVPPIRLSAAQWSHTLATLPPTPEKRVEQLAKGQGLSVELAKQLVADGHEEAFSSLVAGGADGALAARILLQVIPELGDSPALLLRVPEVLVALRAGSFAKEAVPGILRAFAADPGMALPDAIAKAGAGTADASTIDAVIASVIASRADFVRERGLAAMGPLMGPVMAQLRGKADGALIGERLKLALAAQAGAGHGAQAGREHDRSGGARDAPSRPGA